jgi:hypothetical protein
MYFPIIMNPGLSVGGRYTSNLGGRVLRSTMTFPECVPVEPINPPLEGPSILIRHHERRFVIETPIGIVFLTQQKLGDSSPNKLYRQLSMHYERSSQDIRGCTLGEEVLYFGFTKTP